RVPANARSQRRAGTPRRRPRCSSEKYQISYFKSARWPRPCLVGPAPLLALLYRRRRVLALLAENIRRDLDLPEVQRFAGRDLQLHLALAARLLLAHLQIAKISFRFVPENERLLTGRHVLNLERTVLAGDDHVRVVPHQENRAH